MYNKTTLWGGAGIIFATIHSLHSNVVHVDNRLHKDSILMLQAQQSKVDAKQTSVVDRAVFSVWSGAA